MNSLVLLQSVFVTKRLLADVTKKLLFTVVLLVFAQVVDRFCPEVAFILLAAERHAL